MTREQLIEEAAKAAMKEYHNAHWGKNAFENVAEAVFAVFEKAQCKRCGKLAEGYAFIGDDRYCHPDDGVDCYTLASHDLTSLANQAFIEKAQAPTDHVKEAIYEGAEFVCATCPRNSYGAQVAWEHAHPDEREARKVAEERYPTLRPHPGEAMYPKSALHHYKQGAFIAGWKARRPTQAPTDEEREEIVRIIGSHVDMPVSSRLVIARSILAAGFRRPAQTEPTDAQAIAARNELQRRGYGGASLFAMRAALRAAFIAGQEDKP